MSKEEAMKLLDRLKSRLTGSAAQRPEGRESGSKRKSSSGRDPLSGGKGRDAESAPNPQVAAERVD
jgi:hypothetical protein